MSFAGLRKGLGATSPYTGAIVGGTVNAASQLAQAVMRGGDTTGNLVMQAPAIMGTAGSTVVGAMAAAGTIAASTAAIAVPIIGAAVLGITLALQGWFKNRQQKVAASKVVDEIEPYMRQNVDAYLAGPRTVSSQAQALANFDAGWAAVERGCQNVGGSAGQRCISERQAGQCNWHDASGACFNWFSGYRDPIAADNPKPDPLLDASGNLIPMVQDSSGNWVPDTSLAAQFGLGGLPLPLIAGAGLILMALVSGGGGGRYRP